MAKDFEGRCGIVICHFLPQPHPMSSEDVLAAQHTVLIEGTPEIIAA